MNLYARSWAFVRVMSYNAAGFGFVSSRRSPCPAWILLPEPEDGWFCDTRRVSSMLRPIIADRSEVNGPARLSAVRVPALSSASLRSLGLAAAGVAALLGLA